MRKGERPPLNIKKYVGTSVLSVGLLVACALPALSAQTDRVTLSHDATLSGTHLSAGQYKVRWDTHSPEATVEFVKDHKTVLSTEGRVEQRHKMYDHDSVVYTTAPDGSLSLVEIRFAYSNKVLAFDHAQSTRVAANSALAR